jgi:bHLH factor
MDPSKQQFMSSIPRPSFDQIPGYISSYYPMIDDASPTDSFSDRIKHRKELHKEVEKRRRQNINDGILELSKLLPENTPKSKGNIISSAVNYIKSLKSMIGNSDQIQQVEKWNYEKTKLLDEIKNLSNQVKSLKNENESLRALRFEIPMISKETDD